MKKTFLVLGGLLVLINTSIGIIFSSYNLFNMLIADASVILSTLLLFGLYQSSMADGFKMGFTILFAITGFIRFICAVIMPEQLNDNLPLLFFIIFFAIEGFSFFIGNILKNK